MVLYTPAWFTIFQGLFLDLFERKGRITLESVLIIAIIVGLLAVAAFVLQGLGLYKMGKKAGCTRLYLAFVPFANVLLIERLSGEVTFFGHKVRRLGLIALIVEILSAVYHILLAYSMYVLFVKNSGYIVERPVEFYGVVMKIIDWQGLSGTALVWYQVYNLDAVHSLVGLAEAVVLIMLYIGFFKRYAYRNAVWFSVLGMLVPFFPQVAIFCLRNRNRIDYEAMLRARQEAYRRQQQQWQGGPYGGYGTPYGNPYGNPYGRPQNQASEQKPKPEEPFSEFSDDPFSEFSDTPHGGKQGKQPFQGSQSGQDDTNSRGDDEYFN